MADVGKHILAFGKYSHAGVQHSNTISGGDALALSDISKISAMAHFTRSGFGSTLGLYRPMLFVVTVYKGLHFRKTNAGRVQKCLLRAFSKLHNGIFEFRPIRLCEPQVHEDRK